MLRLHQVIVAFHRVQINPLCICAMNFLIHTCSNVAEKRLLTAAKDVR